MQNILTFAVVLTTDTGEATLNNTLKSLKISPDFNTPIGTHGNANPSSSPVTGEGINMYSLRMILHSPSKRT
jgi:hypothetical protein